MTANVLNYLRTEISKLQVVSIEISKVGINVLTSESVTESVNDG